MSFTTPCFIRNNTPELRKKLENIGYRHTPSKTECSQSECIYTHFGSWVGAYGYRDHERYYKEHIDCGTNEPLFLAIAALRDDSDYMQWFTDGEEWDICHGIDYLKEDMTYSELKEKEAFWRKATVSELIEHFKTEE